MEEAIKVLPSEQWASFNRARKYHEVYFLSQILLSDGISVDPAKMTTKLSSNTVMQFPLENPTKSDLAIWVDTIKVLTSSTLRISPKLGNHIRPPYDRVQWRTNAQRDFVVRLENGKEPRYFLPTNMRYGTRGRQTYLWTPGLPSPILDYPYVASSTLDQRT